MSNRRSPYALESLENRTLMAYAGQIVGYYYSHSAANLAKLDLSGLTQLDYAFLGFNSDGTINPFTGSSLTQLTNTVTAAHAKGVKVNIVADNNVDTYESIMANSSYVSTFTSQLVNFAKTNKLDGIDLDWEDFNATSTKVNQFGAMLQTMHTATAANGLTLSAAVLSSQKTVPNSAFSSLDWFNVMDYDLLANSSAPLSQSETYMNNWAGYGVPKSKLLMGVPFYGRSSTSSTDWTNTQTKTYASIAADYQTQYGTAIPANLDSVTLNGTTWGFNGVNTMTTKVNWMKSQGFGGMMIWETTQDYWNSSSQYVTQSLLPAIKSAMTVPFATLANGVLTVDQSLAGPNPVFISVFGTTLGAGTLGQSYGFSPSSAINSIVYKGTSGADSLEVQAGVTQPINYIGNGGSDKLLVSGNYSTGTNLGGSASLAVTVNAGVTLSLSGQQSLNSLTSNGTTTLAAGGASVLNVGSLVLGSSGKLDLNDNTMVLDYTGTSPAATVAALLKSGRAGGAWNGLGIDSSAVAGVANSALGYGEASAILGSTGGTFAGQTVDGTALLVRFTALGDTNLDRTVDAADFVALSNHFGSTGSGWSGGDFNYDGTTDAADFVLLSNNFGRTLTVPAATPAAVPLAAVATKKIARV